MLPAHAGIRSFAGMLDEQGSSREKNPAHPDRSKSTTSEILPEVMPFNGLMPDGEPSFHQLADGLSAAARSVWAKYDRSADGWLPLWRHMADSGAVARLLWDRWLPSQVHKVIAETLPGGDEEARRLAIWLATTHDIGKATPAFACQVESLAAALPWSRTIFGEAGQRSARRPGSGRCVFTTSDTPV